MYKPGAVLQDNFYCWENLTFDVMKQNHQDGSEVWSWSQSSLVKNNLSIALYF